MNEKEELENLFEPRVVEFEQKEYLKQFHELLPFVYEIKPLIKEFGPFVQNVCRDIIISINFASLLVYEQRFCNLNLIQKNAKDQ